MFRDKFANHEQHQADHTKDEQDENKVRAEPVFLLSFVEQHLQATDAESEKPYSPVINSAFTSFDVRRILNEHHDHGDCGNTDRNVDVKQPAPGVAVSDPAAQDWAKHGSHHNTQCPKGHRFAALFRGK